jgi:hypothetical protein
MSQPLPEDQSAYPRLLSRHRLLDVDGGSSCSAVLVCRGCHDSDQAAAVSVVGVAAPALLKIHQALFGCRVRINQGIRAPLGNSLHTRDPPESPPTMQK